MKKGECGIARRPSAASRRPSPASSRSTKRARSPTRTWPSSSAGARLRCAALSSSGAGEALDGSTASTRSQAARLHTGVGSGPRDRRWYAQTRSEMKATGILHGAISVALTVSACSGKDDPDASTTSPTATSTSKGGSSSTSGDTVDTLTGTTSPGTSTTSTDTSTTDASEGTDTECTFLRCHDYGSIDEQCDVWAQDCPEGEKCTPWASDGGSSWNAAKCTPVDPAPQQPGDVCIAEGDGLSGVDNCAKDSMCWDVDKETGEGVCIAFCDGTSGEDASCDPGFHCNLTSEGLLILCFPECDPLLQDCAGDELCIPNSETFTCVLDASGDAGLYGDPCEYANACKPGLYCLNPEYVDGCQAAGCCTPFCDTSKENMCPGDTQECIPWYDEGMAPPGKELIGICGVPQ